MAESNTANAIDQNKQGLIGKALDRIDGPLKVTGEALYAYEYALEGLKPLYGYIVGADIAKGTITSFDLKDAENAPGIAKVYTYKNSIKLKGGKPTAEKKFTDPKPYLFDDKIRYLGEPVALVIAETFEQARYAASLVRLTYDQSKDAIFHVSPNKNKAYKPDDGNQPTDSKIGDFEKSYQNAAVTLDQTYTTPTQNHNAMELHSSIAIWDNGSLTLYSAQQLPVEANKAISETFGVSPEKVRVICRYVGGGFGGKLPVQCDAILSAVAAKDLNRPVKVTMTRQQTFANACHRSETIQRIRLGADKSGKLDSIAHECWAETSTFDEYLEASAAQTRSLYAADNRLTTHRLVKLDLPPSGSMRAPGEATGMLALEQAMDEMAEKVGIDPIEFRIMNEPEKDPEQNIPFSTRALVPCLREGAKRFNWEKRNAKPGMIRDGNWLVGYGVASAIRTNYMQKSSTRIKMNAAGDVTVQMAMTDIGTGTYTVLAQVAAETMGLPIERVKIELGDSSFPPTPGSGGSWGANSTGSSLFQACMDLREKIAGIAVKDKKSPLYGLDADKAGFENGEIFIGPQREDLKSLVTRSAPQGIELESTFEPPKTYKTFSQAGYGAHFAEVGVNSYTGEVRIRRMLGVFTAGRILNEKTATSQATGGMIWGIGSALHEESIIDKRWGQFVNRDFAEYHVPVHADAVNIEAVFLPETDDKTGPLKIKGVGELGICGAGAAIANAVYNACGVRVRQFPITADKIFPELKSA